MNELILCRRKSKRAPFTAAIGSVEMFVIGSESISFNCEQPVNKLRTHLIE